MAQSWILYNIEKKEMISPYNFLSGPCLYEIVGAPQFFDTLRSCPNWRADTLPFIATLEVEILRLLHPPHSYTLPVADISAAGRHPGVPTALFILVTAVPKCSSPVAEHAVIGRCCLLFADALYSQ